MGQRLKHVPVQDEALLRREFYNPSNVRITLELMQERVEYVRLSGISPGKKFVTLEPKGFAIVNHGFYRVHSQDGKPVSLTVNYGTMIGIGNKLPSNPFLKAGSN